MRSYKDLLIRKYEEFKTEEHPERKKLLKLEILNVLNSENSLDSEDFYLWGLTYYMADEENECNTDLALEKFIKAYELNSGNFMTCLYIAHCYQDKGEFYNALKYYERVDKNHLKGFQIWRYVKLIEQIGYCNYTLGNTELGRQQFKQVLEWYKKLPLEDRVVPTEMLRCLPESDEIITEMKKLEDYLN
jgi:tetratricopeptide (TPR) repeat protein